VVTEGQRPHPGASYGRRVGLEDAADYDTSGKHIKVVVAPLTGGRLAEAGIPLRKR
jgi:hypothetical protein